MTLSRVRTVWSGVEGAPGYTIMYARTEAPGFLDALHLLWIQLASEFPSSLTLTMESTGDKIDEVTGNLVGAWVDVPRDPVVGSGAPAYSAPVGGSVRWESAGIVNGRRVRGKTFLVPLAMTGYGTNGRLTPGAVATAQNAVDAFTTAATPEFGIWTRPRKATVPPHKVHAATDGAFTVITSGTVLTNAAVLRSRRD